MEEQATNIPTNLPNHETYVRNERGFSKWVCSCQKFLLVFKNSILDVWKPHLKLLSFIGKKQS